MKNVADLQLERIKKEYNQIETFAQKLEDNSVLSKKEISDMIFRLLNAGADLKVIFKVKSTAELAAIGMYMDILNR